jgi:hypothetical protein
MFLCRCLQVEDGQTSKIRFLHVQSSNLFFLSIMAYDNDSNILNISGSGCPCAWPGSKLGVSKWCNQSHCAVQGKFMTAIKSFLCCIFLSYCSSNFCFLFPICVLCVSLLVGALQSKLGFSYIGIFCSNYIAILQIILWY